MKFRELPSSVKFYVEQAGAVVVGSAAKPHAEIQKVNDIDVLVPFSQWATAVRVAMAYGAILNSNGGLRYTVNSEFRPEGIQVDVWPGDLIAFLSSGRCTNFWMPNQCFYWVRGAAE